MPAANVCCKAEIEKTGLVFRARHKDGERWDCPQCGKTWEHICDEADGCAWYPDEAKEARKRAT